MLIFALALQTAETHAHAWFWQPPSLFDISNWILTLGLFFYIWWQMRKLHRVSRPVEASRGDDVNDRDYKRIVGRLDTFERTQNEMDERLTEMSVSAGQRHEERVSALHELVDVSTRQYAVGEKQTGAIKKLLAQNAWILRTLAERPCVQEIPDDPCPEGHEGTKPPPTPSPPPELLDGEY